jgi:hypothetical protein
MLHLQCTLRRPMITASTFSVVSLHVRYTMFLKLDVFQTSVVMMVRVLAGPVPLIETGTT